MPRNSRQMSNGTKRKNRYCNSLFRKSAFKQLCVCRRPSNFWWIKAGRYEEVHERNCSRKSCNEQAPIVWGLLRGLYSPTLVDEKAPYFLLSEDSGARPMAALATLVCELTQPNVHRGRLDHHEVSTPGQQHQLRPRHDGDLLFRF